MGYPENNIEAIYRGIDNHRPQRPTVRYHTQYSASARTAATAGVGPLLAGFICEAQTTYSFLTGNVMINKHCFTVIATALAAILLLFFPATGRAITGTEVIEKSDQTMQGNTQISLWEITIKTRRWTRTMELKTFMNRKEKKTFSEILGPKKDKGNRFLLLDKLMWHYVPKLGQTIKISPSMMLQSWMGSDFSNDDIVKESSIITDYTHKILATVRKNGHECWEVELSPVPDAAVVWGKILYYARKGDCLPVLVQYYNEHGVMKKELSYDNYRKVHDRVIPTKLKMITVGKKDRHTLLEIKGARFDVPIPSRIFSLQHLKRR